MPAAPFTVTALLLVAAATRALALTIDGGPFSPGPAGVLAVSLLGFTLIAATGLLVARGRWARVLAGSIATGSLGLAVATPLTAWSGAATVAAGVSLGGVIGPWLQRGWLRHRPSADGPPPLVVAAVLGLLVLPSVAAVSLPDGIPAVVWIPLGGAVAAAWGISQAQLWAVWMARIAVPAATAAVLPAAGMPAAVTIGATAALLTALTWQPAVGRSVRPLLPEAAPAVPFPPELVDPAILEAAGFDDRGRPLERP